MAMRTRGKGRGRGSRFPDILVLSLLQGSVAATGPGPDLNAVFAEGGIRVSPHTTEGWTLELKPTGFGAPGAIRPLDLTAKRIEGPWIESTSSLGLHSWYVNR